MIDYFIEYKFEFKPEDDPPRHKDSVQSNKQLYPEQCFAEESSDSSDSSNLHSVQLSLHSSLSSSTIEKKQKRTMPLFKMPTIHADDSEFESTISYESFQFIPWAWDTLQKL